MAKKKKIKNEQLLQISPSSYKSLMYGFITVIVLFIILFLGAKLFSRAQKGEITPEAAQTQAVVTPTVSPAPSEAPTVVAQVVGSPQQKIVGNSYKVGEGDSLWDISVRAYGDGYRWPEIASLNNIQNPDLIYPGQVFKLPK